MPCVGVCTITQRSIPSRACSANNVSFGASAGLIAVVAATGYLSVGPSTWQRMSHDPGRSRSFALLLVGCLPEQLLPAAELRLHGAGAVEEIREEGVPARLRGELEARIVELGHQVVDAVGRRLRLLPQQSGGALVRIGDLDRFLERVGHGLEQRWV